MTGYEGAGDYRHGARVLLIAEGFAGERDGVEALAVMAVAVDGPIDFDEAPLRLSAEVAVDLVMIEAGGIASDRLAATLDAAAALDATRRVPIIVSLTQDQIDEVAARLLTGRVQLLCAPSHAERVAAIAFALVDRGRGTVREEDSDSERLRRLNEEVARIADMLARLTSGGGEPPRRDVLGDRTVGYRAESDPPAPISATEVRQAIRMRRLRDQFFEAGLFEDPAWDMLLDLFAADLERSRVSVSSLCIAAAVAPTTALRWIGRMTEGGLLDREPDPVDRRRAFMILSTKAREGMWGYCAAVKRAGGAIG